ncbi:MAG: hypothetical protein KAH13_03980, partial [Tenericutes bacterium]|nr:hypothetical protein [Mycoplasmatota bacterium]
LVITDAGYIINPHVGANSIDVMLTCTATNSSYSTTESFVLTIQPNPEVNVTSKDNYDFTGTSEEYIVDSSTVDLYFVDNGSVPYIDVQTFIDMVNGAIESDIITIATESDNALTLDYQYEYTDFDGVTVLYEDYSAIIDFDENTFTVNNFDFFSGYVAETESDYGEGLEYVDAFYIDGEEVVIPLGDYNFDLIIYDDGGNTVYLMPFHIINLLLLGNVYYDAYYNGDEIFGIDTFSMSGGDQDIIDQIHDTSYNSNEEVPRDMSLATYNFMAFVIDYFYGLKEDKNLNGYDFMIENAESMIEQSNDELYKRIFDVAYRLDDLHTSHVFTGYYDSSYLTNDYAVQLSWDDLGPGYVEFLNGLYDVQDLLEVKYPSGIIPDYELLDDETKAVIHLTGFTIDTPDEFKAILDNLPLTVEDVVIDLSYNTGGNLGAVLRIYGYITEETLTYHSQNPVDDSAATFYFESDYVAYDYNFYMLTSSVTFSAANLFANMAKEQGIPIVGQDSSGGASSIGFITSPDGSGLLVSSLNILSTRIGDTEETYQYLSIENGISVDYLMDNCTSDFELITIIDQIRAEEIN